MSEQTQNPNITYVPYKQFDEEPSKAAFIRCPIELPDFTAQELEMLKYLQEAVDIMNILYWRVCDPNMFLLVDTINKMLNAEDLTDNERTAIKNYKDILYLQNSPFSEMPEKNHLLQLDKERVVSILGLCIGDVFYYYLFFFFSFYRITQIKP